MNDAIKAIEDYYEGWDAYFARKDGVSDLSVSAAHQKRPLDNDDRSILDDVETLLSSKLSHDFSVEVLTLAIASAGKRQTNVHRIR